MKRDFVSVGYGNGKEEILKRGLPGTEVEDVCVMGYVVWVWVEKWVAIDWDTEHREEWLSRFSEAPAQKWRVFNEGWWSLSCRIEEDGYCLVLVMFSVFGR